MPSYISIKGNERADKVAKEATTKPISAGIDRYSSFSYITRQIKAKKRLEAMEWLRQITLKRHPRNKAYSFNENLELDLIASIARKPLARRFY